MDLMEDYLKFLNLIDHGLGIYYFIIEESTHKKLFGPNILAFIYLIEDNRGSEKKMTHNPNEAKANFVEHGQSSKFK